MKSNVIDINKSIDHLRKLLELDKSISPAIKAAIEVIIISLQILTEKHYKNSKNSHKPPSTDKKISPAFKREKKKRSHAGTTLYHESPNKIIKHNISNCEECGESLSSENLVDVNKRQIIDIKIRKSVIEHQAEVKFCYCGHINCAKFPSEIKKYICYSERVKSQVVYQHISQLVPYKRVASYFLSNFDIQISESSIFNFLEEAYNRLEIWEQEVRDKILSRYFINVDETGIRVGGKLQWIHTYTTENECLLKIHPKRGGPAPEEIGILPNYNGVIVHDCWSTYFKYDNDHALCGCHLIRELNNASEIPKNSWPKKIIDLLVETNNKIKKRKNRKLNLNEYSEVVKIYQQALKLGKKQLVVPKKLKGTKGQTKEEKAYALIERLEKNTDSVLRFAKDRRVPFTNNDAERDLRMVKVKQKISGCFRSDLGAKIYCRIRSYLLSMQKNGKTHLEAIEEIFKK